LRSNIKHIAIAALFLVAQIFASAAVSDHFGDPLHSGDDCTICTTISAGDDNAVPPSATGYTVPIVTLERITPLPTIRAATRIENSSRARAPPASA
jgi:hypothetical protein